VVQAEITWTSHERRKNLEDIVSQFKMAVELVLQDILKKDVSLGKMIEQGDLKKLLNTSYASKVIDNPIVFLDDLQKLNNYRAQTQHGGSVPEDKVKEIRRTVLGIGCKGILPSLLEIKRNLKGEKRHPEVRR